MALVCQFRRVDDVDIFWQVQLGQRMLDTWELQTQDPFTYTHKGEPVPNVGWLAQVFFAALYRLGSWELVLLVHALLFAGGFAVAGRSVRAEEAGLPALTAALSLGFLAALTQSSLRPQSFAVIGFALLLALARSNWKTTTKLLVAVPLLLVWQNAHPSAVVGAVALVPLVVVDWVRYVRKSIPEKPIASTLLLCLAGASQFATPMGWHILETTRVNQEISRDLLHISEWMPPWDASVRGAMFMFWVGLVVSGLLLLKLRLRVDLADLGLFLVFTALSLYSARFSLFWAVAMVSVWARWIELARPKESFAGFAEGQLGRRGAVMGLTLGALGVVVLPLLLRPKVVSEQLPMQGIERLKAELPERRTYRVYNYREWGGPLILEGSPRGWEVSIDGRLYLYPREEWRRYDEIALGRVPLETIEREHKPDAFFLRPSYHRGLIELLRASTTWREVHTDEVSSVWVRR